MKYHTPMAKAMAKQTIVSVLNFESHIKISSVFLAASVGLVVKANFKSNSRLPSNEVGQNLCENELELKHSCKFN